MLTHILPIEENLCVFNEGASPMDPNCAVEKLSTSLQLCEPFCITDSKSLVAPDISRTDVIVGALNSIRIAESSEQKDNKDKDNVRSDDVSETKSADIVYLSPRRRTDCTSKSNQKMGTKKATRKCRKTVNKKLLLDAIFLKVARKRRSGFCKRARSSTWGLLGNIAQFFEQNVGLDVNRTMHKKSRKSRSGRGGGKRNKSQTGQSSQKFNGESIVSTSHIRLKIKLGKGIVQSCLMNSVPLIDNDLEKYWGTRIELPKLTKDIEGKLEEEVPMSTEFQCCSGNMDKKIRSSGASVLDVNIKDDYIAEKFAGNSADNHYGIPSHEEDEGLGVTVDNKCLDPGTSPDSKVPEAQIGGKVPEDLHDVLIPSQDCVAQGDVTSLSLPQMSSKKGEKTNKLCQAGICSVDGRLPISETINSTSLFEKCGLGEKMGDVSYSSEASISTTTRNASGNICSSEGVSTEPLPSSRVTDFGMSTETLKVESGAEDDQCSRFNVGLESPESLISEKLVTCTIPKGQKIPKSSRSKGVSKSRAEVSDSVSRRENACGQKGNQAKLVNKQQAKENGGGGEVVCKVDSYPETGNHTLDDCGETKTGCRSTTADISNLDMVPSRLGDQYVPPQNAWVCCDVCFKWRRIAAVLADSIEETNCKWICKDNVDKMFADCSIPQEKSNAEINAELEISDVSCEEDACDARLNSNQLGQKHSTVPQHSSWKLIKSNLFLHRNRKAQTIDEIMVCHCKAPLNGQLGCGNGCLNRMLNIECVKGTCPCGELCSNQQFQKRKYAKLKSFRCGKKGHGLQLLEDIPKGQFLIEYIGEVLDTQAYEARQREYASKGHKHFYFMTLNGNEVIDACAKGNLGRFINHSCEPNCRTEKWMVNGEVCIGIFAMRDIKKGEEMTFDYNYVRIFGAAAKKCVCGSSQCQGYIGGDPRNAEVIVQGDSDEEYPEPVMVCEDGNSNLENIISASSSFDGTEMQTAENLDKNNDEMDKPTTAVGHIKITKEMPSPGILLEHKDEIDNSVITVGHMVTTTENEDSMKRSSTEASKLEISLEMEGSLGLSPYSIQSIETSLPPDDGKSEIMPAAQQDLSGAEETTNISLCTVQRFEPRSPTTMLSKSLPDTVDIKRKPKPDTEVDKCVSKSRPRMKTSRSSLVKKGKSKHNAVHVNKPLEMNTKSHVVVPCRSKKLFEGSSNDHFEAVQEKLNELLDADGGISKRKDASGGYLKLLFLTAASGDRSNGEAIQSNRDLSMILGALLKTKSRMVLVDIINKNGLQMLHNIMKRYRREFNKIPILRKLLKVLEHLAVREILTLEHINRGPPCRGVESFRESILTLTEHTDKQVHQIARNFRDRWIRRPFKKNNRMDWNVGGMDFHRGSNSNRFSASLNQSCDRSGRPTEAIECVKQSVIPTTQVGAEGCSTSCSSSCVTNATKTRKRKSRWDQPGERNSGPRSPLHKEPRIQPILLQKSYSSSQPEIDEVVLDHSTALPAEEKICSIETNIADDGRNDIDEDLPPGFPHPLNGPLVPPFNASSTALSLQPKNGEQDDGRKNVDEDLPPGFPHPLSGSLVPPSNASSTAISLQPKNGDRDDERKNIDEDLPPGFPHPLNGPLVPPSTASSTAISLHPKSGDREKCPYDVVIGHPWEKFFPQLSVSYGIPLPVVEQFGTPRGETAERWVVAPGMPFHPFPPLPPYPREKINPPAAANSMTMHLPAGKDAQNCHNPVTYHSDRNTQSTSGANPQFSTNQHNFQRGRGSSNSLGRKFFGQEKWNNSKLRRPPWIRNRNGWGFMGKNSRKGFSSIGVGSGENRPQGPYSSEVSISEVSIGMERSGNSFYQYQQHQN